MCGYSYLWCYMWSDVISYCFRICPFPGYIVFFIYTSNIETPITYQSSKFQILPKRSQLNLEPKFELNLLLSIRHTFPHGSLSHGGGGAFQQQLLSLSLILRRKISHIPKFLNTKIPKLLVHPVCLENTKGYEHSTHCIISLNPDHPTIPKKINNQHPT